MKKKQLLRKRMLALVLSTAMVFTPMNIYAVQAQELGNLTATEAGASSEKEIAGKSDSTGETASTEGNSLADGTETTEGIDAAGESETASETDTTNESETAGETDTADEEDAAGKTDSASDSNSGSESDLTNDEDANEETENDAQETPQSSGEVTEELPQADVQEAAEADASEDTEEYIAKYDVKGQDIHWILYKSGKLVIEGVTYGSNIQGFGNLDQYKDSITSAVVNVSAEGDYSAERMFINCKNLKSVDLSGLDLSRAKSMSNMFYGCESLESVTFNDCDTPKLTDMGSMFEGCASLKSADLSSFNTSNVTNMYGMFNGCTVLEQLNLGSLNTGKVTKMNSMFKNCVKLTNLDLSSFDTGNVTDMASMFEGCSGLANLDVSGFNTVNVTTMSNMFKGCSGLTHLDVSGFDTGKVQFFTETFADCSSLISLDVGGLKTNATLISGNMSGMFSNCSSLVSLDLSSFVMNTYHSIDIFNGCSSLAYIYTPLENGDEPLPGSISDHDWYKLDGTKLATHNLICSYDSPAVYRDDYTGEKTEPKKSVFLSGISIDKDKIYDGTANGYIGEPKVIDTAGDEVAGVTVSAGSYTGTFADGSPYEASTSAPVKAGTYKISFNLTGGNADEYNLKQNSFTFNIRPRTVTIAAPSLAIKKGVQRPDLANLTCEITGLVGDDKLSTGPTLKYGEDNIYVFGEETYRIIPYGAEADSNYNIRYINGELAIEAMEYPEDDIPGDGIAYSMSANSNGGISWTLTKSGRLTVEGKKTQSLTTGDDSWVFRWRVNGENVSEKIKSAVVKVSGVNSTKEMFSGCTNLETVDLSGLDTSKVTDMSKMFEDCDALKTLDLSSFDTKNVTNMSYMFSMCSELKYLDISSFNTSKVTNMSCMFEDCNNLKRLDLKHFDTGNVTNMYKMFEYCYTLKDLDLSGFDTGSVTNMNSMFHGCYGLRSLNVSSFDTGSVTDMKFMFSSLTNLPNLDLSNFDTRNVTDMSNMFSGGSSLTSLDLRSFDTGNVTTMDYMFSECEALKSVNLSSFDTGNVTSFDYMFYRCYALTDMDVCGFDTGSATIMRAMFYGCNALTAIDVSGFDTSNVTNMYSMFSSCSSLESIDITGFDTGKVRNISGIFAYCRSLTSLDLSGLNCKEIGTCTDIIKDCTSLIYLKTPVKAPSPNEDLPVNSGDVWYYANSSTQVGRSIPDASFICKNITTVPDDVEIAKPTIFISGVSIEKNKEYDAQPSTYSGTPIAVDSAGNSVENIEVSGGVYTGTLADGSAYTQTTIAPVKAGNYKLAFTITGTDADKYNIKDNSYSFTIRQKTVTVTAPTLTRELNENLTAAGALSGLCDLTNAVNGLLEGEDFITAPQFKYSAENIDTSVAGRYKIIPYGADVGNNYRIKYVNGSLTIGNPDYVPGGSDDDSQDDDSPYGDSERTDIGNSALQAKVSKIKDKVYDGMPYEPALKVTVVENGKKKTLVEGTDYRISYEDNTDAGTGKVIITGSGIYKGVLDPKPTFTIKQKPVKKLKIVAGSAAEEITAANVAQAPVYVYDGSKLLTESEDYSLSLSSKTPNPKASSKAKTYTINITGVQNSNYTGTTTVKVTKYEGIEPSQLISPAGITLEYLTTPYTGKARTPKVTVEVGNTPLAGKDYKVKYQNNKNAGTAYVIVTGKGTYKGTAVLPFNITANTAALEITNNIKAKTYNGKLQKPSVTVKAGKTKLKKNKDYMVSYSNNLHEGKNTAVVTVKGIGNYSGTAAKTFSINPQKISKVSVKGTWKGGLVLTYGNRKLVPNVDYAIKCDNIKKNKAKVTITAIAGKDFDGTAIKNVKLQ